MKKKKIITKNWRPIWKKPEVPEPEQVKSILHTSCKTISIGAFKEVYCNDRFELLGTGTPEEIAQAWIDIVSEWNELMRNNDSDNLLRIKCRILELKSLISYVHHSIFYLRRRHDQEMIDRLIENGFPGDYSPDNWDSYLKHLDRVISLNKTNEFHLAELLDEESRLEVSSLGGKSNEDEFEKDIARLSKYQGYNLDQEKTTAFTYASIFQLFIAEIKARNKSGQE